MAQTATRLILPPALGSYVFVFKPRLPKNGQGAAKYSLCLLWPKTDKALLKPLIDAVVFAATQKFGPAAVEQLKIGKLNNPIHDGDIEKPEDPNFKGTIYVNASSKNPIGVCDAKLQKVFEETECYSGCIIRASVGVFAYDQSGGKGVALGLNNIQVVSKGPHLDNRTEAEVEFKAFADTSGSPPATSTSVDDLL